jgi:hypothetical protein
MKAHIDINKPVVGWYKCRMVSQGPWVAARVFKHPCVCTPGSEVNGEPHDWDQGICDRHPPLGCEVNGREVIDILKAWPSIGGNPIDQATFNHMTAVARWAKGRNDVPEARPFEAVDLNKIDPLF